VDLCAGIGGIRRGFERIGGFENILSAEIDDYACRTYRHLYGEYPKHDIASDEFKQLISDTPYDVLLYGAINTLVKKKWIEPVENNDPDGKKLYALTEVGRKIVADEQKRLADITRLAAKILGGGATYG
jgi:DNA (cytosine-5)-methyltransferase 1